MFMSNCLYDCLTVCDLCCYDIFLTITSYIHNIYLYNRCSFGFHNSTYVHIHTCIHRLISVHTQVPLLTDLILRWLISDKLVLYFILIVLFWLITVIFFSILPFFHVFFVSIKHVTRCEFHHVPLSSV